MTSELAKMTVVRLWEIIRYHNTDDEVFYDKMANAIDGQLAPVREAMKRAYEQDAWGTKWSAALTLLDPNPEPKAVAR